MIVPEASASFTRELWRCPRFRRGARPCVLVGRLRGRGTWPGAQPWMRWPKAGFVERGRQEPAAATTQRVTGVAPRASLAPLGPVRVWGVFKENTERKPGVSVLLVVSTRVVQCGVPVSSSLAGETWFLPPGHRTEGAAGSGGRACATGRAASLLPSATCGHLRPEKLTENSATNRS